jgi:calcineurin-like phosphoesterase family protein
MSEIFLCGDHHFFHNNIIKFADANGNRYRPFDTILEMHETLVDRHNKVVSKRDSVYFLGDVSFKSEGLKFLNEMNGNKILILGNHDTFPIGEYKKYFSSIHGVIRKHDCVLSHVPLHPSQLDRWRVNIHGHLHSEIVKHISGAIDLRYYNVSMENINFTPVSFDIIKQERAELLQVNK